MDKGVTTSKLEGEAWARLREQRIRAATFKLDILVWGPCDDGTPEYEARCKIRDELKKRGHHAEFSEDLYKSPEAVQDPLHDEFLQAEAADAIIMIYKTRGTQTELDRILIDPLIAIKTYVMVEEDVLSNIHTSVSSESWNKMAKAARVIKYKGRELLVSKIDEVCDEIDKLRTQCYLEALRSSRRT